MKRLVLMLFCLSALGGPLQAQTPAELAEHYKRINSAVEDLQSTILSQQRRITELEREVRELRQQVNRPQGDYAEKSEVRRLREAIEEVDKNRLNDRELILKTIKELGKQVAAPPPAPKRPAVNPSTVPTGDYYQHKVEPGHYLSTIISEYNKYLESEGKKGRVTQKMVEEANPGMKPDSLFPGQIINLPIPKE